MNLSNETSARQRITMAVIVSLICALTLAVFFRQQLLNHFTNLSGDPYDGIIQVALLEHWFNVFKGLSNWALPNYFFPHAKVLSDNEGLFIYGVIYSFFRALNIDSFLSGELVNIVIKGIGFIGFFIASKKLFKISSPWALLGAVIFTLSNNSFIQTLHAQLLSVALAPVELALMHTAYTALMASRTRQFFIYGSLSAVWFAMWLLTCVYTSWFFLMFMVIAVAAQLILLGRNGRVGLWRALMANRYAVMLVVLIGLIAVAPFVMIYFSADNATKLRPWAAVLDYTPGLFDIVNVGSGNFLFGSILDALKSSCKVCNIGAGEREMGLTPLLFVLACLCVKDVFTRKLVMPAQVRVMVLGVAIASTAVWLLSIRFGNYSGWYIFYKFWPGGSGLRVVARVYLFLSIPATALVIYYLSRSKWPRAIVLLLCAILIIEQINMAPTATLDRFEDIERLGSIPKPPDSCKSFFSTESPLTIDTDPTFEIGSIYPHNIDAMLIAELVNLPTINGFASFNPPDWNFQYPTRPDYLPRVAQYAKLHALQGLCKFDPMTRRWDANPVLEQGLPRLGYWDFATAKFTPEALSGFADPDPAGRWSVGNAASFKYSLPRGGERKTWKIRIDMVTAMVDASHAQRIIISANGVRKEVMVKNTVRRTIYMEVAAPQDGQGQIDMEFPDAISPKELGINPDLRKLGVRIKSIEIL